MLLQVLFQAENEEPMPSKEARCAMNVPGIVDMGGNILVISSPHSGITAVVRCKELRWLSLQALYGICEGSSALIGHLAEFCAVDYIGW